MKKLTIGNMIAVVAGLSLCASAHAARPADLVIKNATIHTMDEALRGYTAKGPKLMGKFDKFGSITVGKKADLTVLSQNLYKIDVDDITKTYVLLTMMDGRIPFAEPSVLAGPLSHLDVGHYWQE